LLFVAAEVASAMLRNTSMMALSMLAGFDD
jgi:hypothetical protein